VSQLESAIAILEEQMATEAGSQDMSLYEKHTKLKQQLAEAEELWMQLME
jgi:ATP-binding cassette subfamily F protein 3